MSNRKCTCEYGSLFEASGKFLVLCDLFARRRSELPREERHNIMRACHEW